MDLRQTQLQQACPQCRHPVVVDNQYVAGGMNDYGGFVVECGKCQHVFDLRVGRDITMSHVVSGARVLDSYDEGIVGEKERVFAKHGLTLPAKAVP